MERRGGFGVWVAALAVLVILGGAVPYGLLAGQESWSVALFWGGFGLAVVALITVAILGWRDR